MYKSVVLGIDPGSRQIGISIFRDKDLVFFAIKTITMQNQKETLNKMRAILEELLTKYQIDYVAIEKIPFIQQQRSFVRLVYEEIVQLIKHRNIPLIEFSPQSIKAYICQDKKPTKQHTAEILTERYTELSKYLRVSRLWQKRYAASLFDAIAVGFVGHATIK